MMYDRASGQVTLLSECIRYWILFIGSGSRHRAVIRLWKPPKTYDLVIYYHLMHQEQNPVQAAGRVVTTLAVFATGS